MDPLFAAHDTLNVVLTGPFGMLTRERPDEEEAPGKFRYETDEGAVVELDTAIRTRGRNRRDRETCNFPPIRLNFKKSQTKDTLFDKQDKLKLVTHCETGSQRYEQSVLSEYLAYRIFNVFTDASFRVRLLRITYEYTDRDRELENYGILIESTERLGKRLDAETLTIERVTVADIRPRDLNLTSIFQYFLGNTDFSPIASAPDDDCCHNQALLAPKEGLYFSVP